MKRRGTRVPSGRSTLGVAAVAAVVVSAVSLGVIEGSVYPAAGGPRIPLLQYWVFLALIVALSLRGALALFAPRARHPVRLAICLLPFALVLQDAPSRLIQGHGLADYPWEASTFGRHWLTSPQGGAPGWYYAAAALTILALAAVPWLAFLRRPARLSW